MEGSGHGLFQVLEHLGYPKCETGAQLLNCDAWLYKSVKVKRCKG